MSSYDMVKQAIDLLQDAGVPRFLLEKWEERAVSEVSKIERENRAQKLLPFGRDYAAGLLECSSRNVYVLAQKARIRQARIIEEERAKVANQGV
jgi:hypothetical protein